MFKYSWSSTVVGLAVAAYSVAPARAGAPPAYFRAVDVGVPTDGSRQMTNFRGYIIQAVSTVGPIRRVDLASTNDGIGGGIFGGIAQRWTDPTASSNYTVKSPGPLPDARNDVGPPSDLNFDSHFIVRPGEAMATDLLERAEPFGGFVTANDPIFPGFHPIPSTPSIGYGFAIYDRFMAPEQATLQGDVTFAPAFRDDVVDVAYVVANVGFRVDGNIFVAENTFAFSEILLVEVPEPSVTPLVVAVSHMVLSRRKVCSSKRSRRGVFWLWPLRPRSNE